MRKRLDRFVQITAWSCTASSGVETSVASSRSRCPSTVVTVLTRVRCARYRNIKCPIRGKAQKKKKKHTHVLKRRNKNFFVDYRNDYTSRFHCAAYSRKNYYKICRSSFLISHHTAIIYYSLHTHTTVRTLAALFWNNGNLFRRHCTNYNM